MGVGAVRGPAVKAPGTQRTGRKAAPAPGRRRPFATPGPRRVSGPANGSRRAPAASRGRSGGNAGFGFGLIAALGSLLRLPLEAVRLLLLRLADLRLITWLIDRGWARALPTALFGRIWIAVVAFALIGIVTLQLGLLKLNASIGRALEHEALLQRENAALSIENSEAAASASVESRARGAGMELVPSGLLRLLGVRPGYDATQAGSLLGKPLGTSTSGSAETPTSATPAQTGTAPPSSEPSSAGSGTTPSSAASSGAQAPEAGTPGPTTTAPATEAAATRSPESGAGAAPQSASSPVGEPSKTAPGGGSSAEAPPAGGTQPAGAGG